LKKINILITRPEEEGKKLADLFDKNRFNPILFPTIRTTPIDPKISLSEIEKFDIIIFTSKKAVKYFFQRFPIEKLKSKEFLVVGEKTADELKKLGVENITISPIPSSEGILQFIRENWNLYKNKKFLLPKSKIGIKLLEENLNNIYPIYIYDTKINYPENKKAVENLLQNGEIDFIIFSSPSTVDGFKENFGKNWRNLIKDTKIIAIGRTTSKKLEKEGITGVIIPEKPKNEAIKNLIIEQARYLR
jgi:uroporphyrinogen-III synthase